MKTLDRYIVRTFLTTAFLFLVVMMLLRIVLDLFTNVDEFTEHSGPFLSIMGNIWAYYATQSLVYFIELGGLIIVASAAFSLARMNHTNELTAMLASGVSLHRVVLPIIICSMLMGGVIILDQELLVPRFAHLLIRDPDEAGKRAKKEFIVPVMTDSNNTGWYSEKFTSATQEKPPIMKRPAVILRNGDAIAVGRACTSEGGEALYGKFGNAEGWHIKRANLAKLNRGESAPWPAMPSTERIWTRLDPTSLLGKLVRKATPGGSPREIDRLRDVRCGLVLSAEKFHTDPSVAGKPRTGYLKKPRFVFEDDTGRILGVIYASRATWVQSNGIPSLSGFWKLDRGALFIESNMTPDAIVLRQSAEWISYMSTFDLTQLLQFEQHIPGEQSAVLTLHTRVANPINNLVMLLLGLPFILSRQRNLRKSVGLNILVVGGFYVFMYGCRYIDIAPIWAAWLPILIFGPLAVLMFDTVKT
ncbi:MAG: LptF/LptG family permease [Phycisphaerae bacterium]|jgi:lipopolysaccharide export LptBFGC system permease protein LptF|nr:LptF/LptG family permease [Phycisphaerae bacterium]